MREKDLEYIKNGTKYRRIPLIDNQLVTVHVGEIAGYCHCRLHKGYVTVNLMNIHNCLGKSCKCLEKFEEYPYWVRAANRKISNSRRRAANRRKKKHQEEEYLKYEQQMLQVLEDAQQIVKDYEFPITITRIAPSVSGEFEEYVINYVSSLPFDDQNNYAALAKELGFIYYGRFNIRRLRMPDGRFATPEDWEKRVSLTGRQHSFR